MDQISYNPNFKYIVFDFETESLSLSTMNRPWQISWLVCEGEKTLEAHDRFIWWPDLNVGKGAAAITGFNYNVYKSKAEDPVVVWNDFKDYFYGSKNYAIVTQNGLGFDYYVLKSWLEPIGEWRGYSSWINRSLDTKVLSQAYKCNIKVDRENFPAWLYKVNSDFRRGVKTSLGIMCQELGVDYDPSKHHDAIYDVELTKQVLLKLAYKLDI